jgi:hypothetical protein
MFENYHSLQTLRPGAYRCDCGKWTGFFATDEKAYDEFRAHVSRHETPEYQSPREMPVRNAVRSW